MESLSVSTRLAPCASTRKGQADRRSSSGNASKLVRSPEVRTIVMTATRGRPRLVREHPGPARRDAREPARPRGNPPANSSRDPPRPGRLAVLQRLRGRGRRERKSPRSLVDFRLAEELPFSGRVARHLVPSEHSGELLDMPPQRPPAPDWFHDRVRPLFSDGTRSVFATGEPSRGPYGRVRTRVASQRVELSPLKRHHGVASPRLGWPAVRAAQPETGPWTSTTTPATRRPAAASAGRLADSTREALRAPPEGHRGRG